MKICLLMIGDGRTELHDRAFDSLIANVGDSTSMGRFAELVQIDDTDHELGFAGAIQAGWNNVTTGCCDYIFHFEADFVFNWPVDLDPIIQTLDERRYLTQIALLRQPVNEAEVEAGGIIGQHPESYEQVELADGRAWIEHSRFFTTNPSVYPAWIAKRGWPQQAESEGHFGMQLFHEDAARRSAFWGHGEQWIEHIGEQRTGNGY